jgi:hypothetical protein
MITQGSMDMNMGYNQQYNGMMEMNMGNQMMGGYGGYGYPPF